MADPSPAPGWYPVDATTQRYWDGARWTDHTAPIAAAPAGPVGDDKTLAILAHVLTLIAGFLAPLIIYLVKKDDSPYVRHHAAQALNFQLSIIIYAIVSFILILVLIGILLLLALGVGAFVLTIVAAIKASNGEWYRYPLAIPFVR